MAAIDLDKLEQANDLFGHEHGDRLVRCCPRLWAAALGETDFIARIGGGRIMLADAPAGEPLALAEETGRERRRAS